MLKRRVLGVWVVLALAVGGAGCRRHRAPSGEGVPDAAQASEPAPEMVAESPDDEHWLRATNWDRTLTFTQRSGPGGRCRVEGQARGETTNAWADSPCVGSRDDWAFLSADGARLVVLYSLPEFNPPRWEMARAVALYERGRLVKQTTVGAWVRWPTRIRIMQRHVAWLKGASGIGGAPPRFSEDGNAIHADTAEGRLLKIGFDGTGIPDPPHIAAEAPVRPSGMVKYRDEQGTIRFAANLGEVPSRFRARAVPLTEELNVVAREGPSAPKPSTDAGVVGTPTVPGKGAPDAGVAPARPPPSKPPIKKSKRGK